MLLMHGIGSHETSAAAAGAVGSGTGTHGAADDMPPVDDRHGGSNVLESALGSAHRGGVETCMAVLVVAVALWIVAGRRATAVGLAAPGPTVRPIRSGHRLAGAVRSVSRFVDPDPIPGITPLA